MAIKKVELQKVDLNAGKSIEFVAPEVASDGFAMNFTAQDERTVFLFQNTSTSNSTIKVKAGNGIQGVNDIDEFTIPGSGFVAYRLDSGAFKNVIGDNKGYAVFIPSALTVKGAVIQLP